MEDRPVPLAEEGTVSSAMNIKWRYFEQLFLGILEQLSAAWRRVRLQSSRAPDGRWVGGKTGTGPDRNSKAPGPGSDGCFAGLILDPQGKAQ